MRKPYRPFFPCRGAMDKNGDAVVTPNQPWSQDGTSTAAPIPPFPDLVARTLPLEHLAPGNYVIRRSEFPQGLVVIPTGHAPATTPATLPVVSSSGNSVQLTGDGFAEWPDGFVIWFLSQ